MEINYFSSGVHVQAGFWGCQDTAPDPASRPPQLQIQRPAGANTNAFLIAEIDLAVQAGSRGRQDTAPDPASREPPQLQDQRAAGAGAAKRPRLAPRPGADTPGFEATVPG